MEEKIRYEEGEKIDWVEVRKAIAKHRKRL
jgi:hypothetical protein